MTRKMRTFHQQLKSISALQGQALADEALTFPPGRSKFFGFSPEAESGETPREEGKRKGQGAAWRDLAEHSLVSHASSRSPSPLRLLSPYTVLFFSSIVLSQQFGGAATPGGQLLPSLVGATLRSLPELHAAQPGVPASSSTQHPPGSFGESHDESASDRRLQNRRLSAVLRLLRRAEKALGLAPVEGDQRVVLLMRNALEHISHLGAEHRASLADPLGRFAVLLAQHIEKNGEAPELLGVLDAVLTVIQ